MNRFFQDIKNNFTEKGSCLCVGLDPDISRMPEKFRSSESALFDFLAPIIDATADKVCAYKPNMAFFEVAGPPGIEQLIRVIRHIRDVDPGIPILLDAKRGDIGNTAKKYAESIFEVLAADGTTVNPYMGRDTIEPFTEYVDKGVFALCLTSNPGYIDFENRVSDGEPIFIHIAKRMAGTNSNKNIGLVVGATHPSEAEKVREAAPELPFLMPGIGAQGGDPAAIMKIGTTESGFPPIVNSSRGILYAGSGDDFAVVAGEAAAKTRDKLNMFMK